VKQRERARCGRSAGEQGNREKDRQATHNESTVCSKALAASTGALRLANSQENQASNGRPALSSADHFGTGTPTGRSRVGRRTLTFTAARLEAPGGAQHGLIQWQTKASLRS
jgi:hypothetical protein